MKPNHEIASHLGQLLWHHASTTASSNCGMVSISKAGGLGLVLSGQLLCNAHFQTCHAQIQAINTSPAS
jgi:hypothetical protein